MCKSECVYARVSVCARVSMCVSARVSVCVLE